MKAEVKTLVIDNFHGVMSWYRNGDVNSGFSNVVNSGGYDPFIKPNQLTWMESPVQIDPTGAVITDLIMASKPRLESGISYVYAIGHTGRLYKIQVNDPTTYNPDYDQPTLIATISINSPTFTKGGFMDFFGATSKIFIGHDKGVTSINFDGTGEAFVGVLGNWTQNVPRPFQQFVGNLCIGNGNNFAVVDSTATVSSYTKLSPGFPTGVQIRDMDVTPEGTYLKLTVTDQALVDMTSTTPPTSLISPGNSWIFSWNGVDSSYTSVVSFPTITLTANVLGGQFEFIHGYDWTGLSQFTSAQKVLTSLATASLNEVFPNATFMMGNLLTLGSTVLYQPTSQLIGLLIWYGAISEFDEKPGYWSPMVTFATGTETDVLRIPYLGLVSNAARGFSTDNYPNHVLGTSKIYFSALETSATTAKYKLYKWSPGPTGLGTVTPFGQYETQSQLFSKKISISEVRVYGEPWVAGNGFLIDLIGSNRQPITNGSKAFIAGSNLTIGNDFAWYGPDMAPTYALGVRITQIGSTNHTINKIEIDYNPAGK